MPSLLVRTIATARWAGLAAALTLAQGAAAVTLGQIDDFEDGTTQGWVVGIGTGATSPVPPVAVATGGPDGADDGYLLLTSVGGFGAGSRLAVINATQWAGDYTTSGISGRTSHAAGGLRAIWLCTSSSASVVSNGNLPVNSSNRVTPSE